MALTKKSTSKPAGKFAVKGGKSGGMHDFEGVGPQKPGVSGVSKSGTSGKFAKGGPGGKMHGFAAVKAQKSGAVESKLMASGFTRPNEKLSRGALNSLAGQAKLGKATITDYAKSSMTKKPTGKWTAINPKTKA